MFERVLNIFAPHHCLDCGQAGSILCGNCKYDIVSEPQTVCAVCEMPSSSGVCRRHHLPYSRVWIVARRHGVIEKLINDMKYQSNRAACRMAADLLAETTPELPSELIIVPVPTVAAHIRQRGYDHTRVITKRLAGAKGCQFEPIIKRIGNTRQVGSSRTDRIRNAKQAFVVDSKAVDATKTYLVVDDVYTTGSTAKYACKALRQAGAGDVWLAVVARQDL